MNSKLFFLMMIPVIAAVGCGHPDSGQRAEDLTKAYEDSVRQLSFTSPIPLDKAKKYIGAFTDSPSTKPVRDAMGVDMVKCLTFDRLVLARFADQFNKGHIDGFRLYLAKYTGDANEQQPGNTKNFTLILVGTKMDPVTNEYKDTLVPVPSSTKYYLTLEDYSNPCKPTPCPGATLPTYP